MRTSWWVWVAGVVFLHVGGCANDGVIGPNQPLQRETTVGDGIPCGVVDVLQRECAACHSNPPVSGAPMPLLTYADLLAPSGSDPSRSYAEVSLERMTAASGPMPPGAGPAAESVAVFQAWIDAGMPQSDASVTCTPTEVMTTCTSGAYWTLGDEGDNQMHPGYACISCHENNAKTGPPLRIGGTVYPAPHEQNDCNGLAGVLVHIVDADGRTLELTTNGAGNFEAQAEDDNILTFPITASLSFNGKTVEMMDPVGTADCNSCHTEAGSAGAPGRIVAP